MSWFDFIATYRRRFPVSFKSMKEENAVAFVAEWATRELNLPRDDRKLLYSRMAGADYTSGNIRTGRIPAEELAVLMPFIDLIIDGKGPRLNLPPEYDQEEYMGPRREALRHFKKRMQTERLWPQLPSYPSSS